MKQLLKAKPTDKVEQAVQALHDYIIGGELEPGTALPSESEMVKQIGVSKVSMREALRVVQSQGLVEIAQGRRTRVADISIKPATGILRLLMKRSKYILLELTEARESLEISVARHAALRRTDEHIAAMSQTISDMEANRDDLSFCVEKDIEFHEIMVRSTQNRVFELIHESLTELLRESRKETIRSGGIDNPISEHKKILTAVKDKDPDKAMEYMGTHLETAKSNLSKVENGE